MKKILGLDLGTNSIGWAVIGENESEKKILGLGSRIIPMGQDVLGKFDSGVSVSQTAERTRLRGVRRLRERKLLRRERLHQVLYILGFLPEHYHNLIDFEINPGKFLKNEEPKIAWENNADGRFEFLFHESFNEMLQDFKKFHPSLFLGNDRKVPYDWTIY
ncbi:MAG: type II CRISPR RNA-guided endonuclease Cas9, partial [Bacteroidetes bacterium]|nr:type II CRISPR RNA-guided endonuclease Cas9 [Bacteroidota bacterium]